MGPVGWHERSDPKWQTGASRSIPWARPLAGKRSSPSLADKNAPAYLGKTEMAGIVNPSSPAFAPYRHENRPFDCVVGDGGAWTTLWHRQPARQTAAFMVGDQPTIADFSLCGYMFYPLEESGYDVAVSYPHIHAWLQRLRQLPGWASPTTCCLVSASRPVVTG